MCRKYLLHRNLHASDVKFDFVFGLSWDRKYSWSGLPALYATRVQYPYVQVGKHAVCTHLGGHDSYPLCQFLFPFVDGISHPLLLSASDIARRYSSSMALRSANEA